MTSHARNDRRARLEYIVDTVGIGKVMCESCYEDRKQWCNHRIHRNFRAGSGSMAEGFWFQQEDAPRFERKGSSKWELQKESALLIAGLIFLKIFVIIIIEKEKKEAGKYGFATCARLALHR